MKTICHSTQKGTITYLNQKKKKALVVDFLLFAKEAKLCLLLTSNLLQSLYNVYYEVTKMTFRTHLCSICSHIYAFDAAEFPFLGMLKVQRSKRGNLPEGLRGTSVQSRHCYSAQRPYGSQLPLCNCRCQYITISAVSQ